MRVLVADDELPARQRLAELLSEIDPACQVVTASDGLSALELAQQQAPQVALLDIRMPGLDGIDLAMRLSELPCPPAVVFITAYDEHALAAFEANAIAYLLKPIRAKRLREALYKAQLFSRAQQQALNQASSEAALSATLGGRLMRIPLSQVLYLRADQKYVEVCHEGGLALLDESLKSIEERFPNAFLRIHRNALVAPQHMRELLREPDGSVQLVLRHCAQRLEVSRRHLPEVRRRLRSGRT